MDKKTYQGMSLRNERVANRQCPSIPIFIRRHLLEKAMEAGYGIEEEGLFYEIQEVEEELKGMALNHIGQRGLGVCLTVDEENIRVYCRQFKERKPLLEYSVQKGGNFRLAGQNAARIIKHKPFLPSNDKGLHHESTNSEYENHQ